MVAFIEQEANEKAEEIEAKAEEEFNIEKGRLVQEQRLKIMEFYEKREKQEELKRRIHQSHLLNQSRLQVLRRREELIKTVLDESRSKLSEVTRDSDLYGKVLHKLISQCVFRLIEQEIEIRCRKADLQLVEKCVAAVKDEYSKATGGKKKCNIKVDQTTFLNAEM